jgi:hypothetical protein
VRLLHDLAKVHATLDDPNLVSRAGLVPVLALGQRAGFAGLAGAHVGPGGPGGSVPVLDRALAAGLTGTAAAAEPAAPGASTSTGESRVAQLGCLRRRA